MCVQSALLLAAFPFFCSQRCFQLICMSRHILKSLDSNSVSIDSRINSSYFSLTVDHYHSLTGSIIFFMASSVDSWIE